MERKTGVSAGFRKVLRRELPRWRDEGVVSPEQAAALSERYALEDLDRESAGLAVHAIYIVGAVLVGGGVVSFVAAHWEAIPAAVKLLVIVAAMLAAHAGGFHLWKVRGTRPRLGHALVTVGTLVFGANIGLVAQIFHLSSNFYNGFAAWAVGALAVAWAAASVPSAVVAVAASFVWACGWIADHEHSFCFYPFLALAVFMPFAYLRRSALVFFSALAAAGMSLVVCAGFDADEPWAAGLACAAVAGLAFSWGLFSRSDERTRHFAAPAMTTGLLVLGALAYLLSFKELAKEFTGHHSWRSLHVEGWLWTVPVGAALAATVGLGVAGARRAFGGRAVPPLVVGGAAALALVTVGLGVMGWMPLLVLATAACLVLAGGLVWSGAVLRDRRLIWAGVLFAVLTVTSRFFEYETGLLLKSLAFLASGAALIVTGIKVEAYLKRKAAA